VAVTICPTVTVDDSQKFQTQVNIITSFASRIHIDLSDGIFSPEKLLPIDDVWWPGNVHADLHVMYESPFDHITNLIGLDPQLIITHVEAQGDVSRFSDMLHDHGIKVGIALLADTPVERLTTFIDSIDHVLIFTGKLGYYGGHANLGLLSKVSELKSLKPSLEIGWDGGINDQNIRQLIDGGVEVLNVGGYIARSDDPRAAYAKLEALAGPQDAQ